MSNEETLVQIRIALLKYYSSESMKHGELIIALCILMLTTVSTNLSLPPIFRYAILSFFFSLLVYTVGRTLHWGYFASEVLNAPESDTEGTHILRLHLGTDESVSGRGKNEWLPRISRHFTRLNPKVITVSFVLSFLLLLALDPETNAMIRNWICSMNGKQ